jgi:hypothetical protein
VVNDPLQPKRGRGKRGPDKQPRKKRTPVVVDVTKNVVDQLINLKPDPVDQAFYAQRAFAKRPKRKRTPTRSFSSQVPVPLVDAVDELVEEWETERAFVLRVALAWVVLTYGPEIAAKYGIAMPKQFSVRLPPPPPPPNPYGLRTTWDDPGIDPEAALKAVEKIRKAAGLADAQNGVVPPEGALSPSSAHVLNPVGNGAPKRL